MNIGIFTDSFTPEVNGVVTSLELFIAEFRRLGHSVFIFAPNNSLHANYSAENYTKRFPSFLIFGGQFRLAFPYIKTPDLAKLKLNVIHIHTPGTIGVAGLRIAKKLKIPTVYTYHTCVEQYAHFYLHLPKWTENKLFLLTSKNFYNKHKIIIAPSNGIKQTLQKFIKAPIEVIPTGIDMEKNLDKAKSGNSEKIIKIYNLDKNNQILITAGRLGKEKNFEFIINAFPKIKSKAQQTKLLIVGSGPNQKNLEQLAKQTDYPDDIIFLGKLKQTDLFSLYRTAKAFLYSSFSETQGLVVLEAMSMSLPIVALKATGIEDLISNNTGGFMIENNNEDDFINKTLELLNKPDIRNQKSLEAYQRAKEFTVEKMAKKTLDIYQSLLNK